MPSENVCRILGIMHGDGNMSFSRVLITDKCYAYHLQVIHPLFWDAFGVKLNPFHDKNRNSYYSHTKNKKLFKYFTDVLKLPEGSVRKGLKTHNFMKRWDKHQKSSYIAGLYDSEGYVSNRQAEIAFTTTSKEIHDYIRKHLKNISITNTSRIRKRRKLPEYEIRIYGKANIALFLDNIEVRHPEKLFRINKFLVH